MKILNPSIKHHLIIGTFISVWVFLFVLFIKPFEHGQMTSETWVAVSLVFSLLSFFCYAIVSLIQKNIYNRILKWNWGLEITCLFIFYLFYSVTTFWFYKSPPINGYYTFFEFFNKIILTGALVFVPIFIFARKYSIKYIPAKKDMLAINGENKLDVLKINKTDLVCISNSQNYIEIFYIESGQLKTKLIRKSLKKIQNDLDFLVQVHRSHLINPHHFKSWKNKNTILLTQIEIPVSKTYKERLKSL